MTITEHKSDSELTKYTPYHAFTIKLLGGWYEDLGEKWTLFYGISPYFAISDTHVAEHKTWLSALHCPLEHGSRMGAVSRQGILPVWFIYSPSFYACIVNEHVNEENCIGEYINDTMILIRDKYKNTEGISIEVWRH